MKAKLSLIVILLLLALALPAFTSVAGSPCTGERYNGHPKLVEECWHNYQVRMYQQAYPGPEWSPYPAPEVVEPYPQPEYPPRPTQEPPPPFMPTLPPDD